MDSRAKSEGSPLVAAAVRRILAKRDRAADERPLDPAVLFRIQERAFATAPTHGEDYDDVPADPPVPDLDSLPDARDRALLLGRFWADMTHEAIGRVLQMDESTVRRRVDSAIAALKTGPTTRARRPDLRHLPDDLRAVAVLSAAGFADREVASLLRMSLSTARRRLRSAVAALND